MAVDNPYTGGKSSLEDLARMRSLKRSFAIAHKEGQENVRRARNVNDAADPSWEVSQRLRDRMTKEVAKNLTSPMLDPDNKGASAIVGDELQLARVGGGLEQQSRLSDAVKFRLSTRLNKTLEHLGPSVTTSSNTAVHFAGRVMKRLFGKSEVTPSEAKIKAAPFKATPPAPVETKPLVALQQLGSATPNMNSPESTKPVTLPQLTGKVLSDAVFNMMSKGSSFTMEDIYGSLTDAQKNEYTALFGKDAGKPKDGSMQALFSAGYKPNSNGKFSDKLTAKSLRSGDNVIVTIKRKDKDFATIIYQFNGTRMETLPDGSVKFWDSEQNKADHDATGNTLAQQGGTR